MFRFPISDEITWNGGQNLNPEFWFWDTSMIAAGELFTFQHEKGPTYVGRELWLDAERGYDSCSYHNFNQSKLTIVAPSALNNSDISTK